MDTQFGLAHVWSQGDWVTRAVATILLGMSLASWMVIVIKALNLRRQRGFARAANAFWHERGIQAGLNRLGNAPDNPFHHLVHVGQQAAWHLGSTQAGQVAQTAGGTAVSASQPGRHPGNQLGNQLNASDWVTRELRNAIDEFTANLQGGMAILASVGSTAPFVGLFGTVWGIYHALLGIGAAGQATIDKVAGPIGEALIMTALGLAVAIPAVLGYNALVRGNKGVLHKLNRFGHDLHALFVTGARVGQGTQTDGAANVAAGPAVVPLRKP